MFTQSPAYLKLSPPNLGELSKVIHRDWDSLTVTRQNRIRSLFAATLRPNLFPRTFAPRGQNTLSVPRVQISSREGLAELLARDRLQIDSSAALSAMTVDGIAGLCRVVMVPTCLRQTSAFIKADDAGVVVFFPDAELLESALRAYNKHLQLLLADLPCSPPTALAVYAAILTLHPFADGNGRVSRCAMLALQCSPQKNSDISGIDQIALAFRQNPGAHEYAMRSLQINGMAQPLWELFQFTLEEYGVN